MKRVDDIIDEVIRAEGGYSDNPNDAGGKTMFGITEKVARANGYTGDMRNLPIELARKIYFKQYITDPGFDRVLSLSPAIASELVDTGVNCGTGIASEFLQRALNAFNQRGHLWPDLVVDGGVGQKTIDAMAAYLKNRAKDDGEAVMLRALNALQGARYIEIGEANPKNEDFEFGWFRNRVVIPSA